MRRGLDLVLLDEGRRLVGSPLPRQSPEDLKAVLLETRPALVAIDSPPTWGRSGSSRVGEKELRRLGIHLYATPSDPARFEHPFYAWMKAGHRAFAAAGEVGYPLYRSGSIDDHAIEVFPHASAVALKRFCPPRGVSRNATLKREWRRAVLEKEGIDTSALRSLDEIDAALAALTGLHALEGDMCALGDPVEGVVILPRRCPVAPFPREGATSETKAVGLTRRR